MVAFLKVFYLTGMVMKGNSNYIFWLSFFAEFIKILNKAYDSVELLLIFKKLVSSKIILDKVSKVYYYTYIVSSDNILTKQCIFIRHKCRKGGYYGNTV